MEENSTFSHGIVTQSVPISTPGNPCVERSDEFQEFYELAQYITGLIVYPIVCFLGIIGNSISLIVLSHNDMKTSTNVYLSALAVSDTLKLANDMMYFVCVLLKMTGMDDDSKIITNFYPYAHYIFNMSVCVTAWLTVSVAVERYISVCHISKAKEMCTITRAKIVSTVVFISMIIFCIPSALRYRSDLTHAPHHNTSCYIIISGALGGGDFQKYYTWIQNSLRSFIPLLVLIILNARIINELRKERVKGKKLSSRNKITLMLIAVIIFYVVCVMPDAIMTLFFGIGYIDETNRNKGIREITDSLLAINSAFNFVLYCSMSHVFRKTFEKIFCPKCYSGYRQADITIKNGKIAGSMTNIDIHATKCQTPNDIPTRNNNSDQATFV